MGRKRGERREVAEKDQPFSRVTNKIGPTEDSSEQKLRRWPIQPEQACEAVTTASSEVQKASKQFILLASYKGRSKPCIAATKAMLSFKLI